MRSAKPGTGKMFFNKFWLYFQLQYSCTRVRLAAYATNVFLKNGKVITENFSNKDRFAETLLQSWSFDLT